MSNFFNRIEEEDETDSTSAPITSGTVSGPFEPTQPVPLMDFYRQAFESSPRLPGHQIPAILGRNLGASVSVAPIMLAPVPAELFEGAMPKPVLYFRPAATGDLQSETPIVGLPQPDPPDLSEENTAVTYEQYPISRENVYRIWDYVSEDYRDCKKAIPDFEEQLRDKRKKIDDLMEEKEYYRFKCLEIAQKHGTTSVSFADAHKQQSKTQSTYASSRTVPVLVENQTHDSHENRSRHKSHQPIRSSNSGETSIAASSSVAQNRISEPSASIDTNEESKPSERNPGIGEPQKLESAVEKPKTVSGKSKEGGEKLTSESGKPTSEAPTGSSVADDNSHVEPKSHSGVASQDTHEKAAKTWQTWKDMGFQSPKPFRVVNASDTPSSSSETHTSSSLIESSSRIPDDGFETPKPKKIATASTKSMSAHMEKAQRLSRLQSQNSQPEKVSALQELVPEESSELKEEAAVKAKTVQQMKKDVARSRGSDKSLESFSWFRQGS